MLAQILGIAAFCFSVLTYQQNTHKRIVAMQLLAGTCFTIHFYLLSAYTGALLNAIGVIRSLVYICKDKKWASSNLWIVFFSMVSTAACMYTWEGPLSLLPTLGMIFTSIAFGINNPKKTRLFSCGSSPLWLVYNLVNRSYGGVLTEGVAIVSILVGMLRFDRKQK
ncbi:MAG: YgjV family protein [Ruminococcaceae bacterium]|nr:YgjV family protein [Oscillospiraceae bacterium]